MSCSRALVIMLALYLLVPCTGRAALESQSPEPVLLLKPDGLADRFFPGHVFAFGGDLAFFYVYEHTIEGDPHRFDDDALRISLWRTDGTPEGTFPLLPPEYSFFYAKDTLGEVLVIGACRPAAPQSGLTCEPSTQELWRTDGTLEGTFRLIEEQDTFLSLSGTQLVPELGLVFFIVRYQDGPRAKLWVTDGTRPGTRLVQDLTAAGYTSPLAHLPDQLVTLGGDLYFVAPEDSQTKRVRLSRSDGTPAGTSFSDLPIEGDLSLRLVADGHRLFLLASGTPEWDPAARLTLRPTTLWSIGIDDGDWQLVGDLGDRSNLSNVNLFAEQGRAFVYVEDRGKRTYTLWGSGDTPGKVEALAELPEGRASSFSIWTEPLLLPQRRAFIRLPTGAHGVEPWISDGTAAGTEMLADLCPGDCSSLPWGIGMGVGGSFLFTAYDNVQGWALRRWRPKTGEVDQVAGLCPPECTRMPRLVGTTNGRRFIASVDPSFPRTLWRIDEEEMSAQLVAELGDLAIDSFFFYGPSTVREWGLAGDRWIFWGRNQEHGVALWSLQLPTLPSSPPPGPALTSSGLPGFAVKVRIGGDDGIVGRAESDCLAETLCVSGALPGRSEVFVRIVDPRPNGKLWPTLVKFTTSTVEVWIEQLATGIVRYYRLEGATPGSSELPGLFDRDGFSPAS